MEPFNHITIVGLGVIGGSLAKSLKQHVPECTITGVDSAAVCSRARSDLVIDREYRPSRLKKAVSEADLVILAVPVKTSISLLPRLASAVKPGALVTDTGSTKGAVTAAAAACFFAGTYFLGGHPMTGSAGSGYEHSDYLLFENACYLLTPEDSTPRQVLSALAQLLERTGAKILLMNPALHDRITAVMSHLPQLLAVGLMNTAARRNHESACYLKLAAGGFRDMTRVASSPWNMWKDILETNRAEILTALDDFLDTLGELKSHVGSADMEQQFDTAARNRLSVPQDTRGFFKPHFDLLLWLEDKPGVIAGITSVLAAEGITISDIEILKIREGDAGTLRLSFAAETTRRKSAELLAAAGFRTAHRQHT